MQLIKYTHACVRLEHGDDTVLIDPGTWAEDAAFIGTNHVLITHEHVDHIDADRLATAAADNSRLRVYAPEIVAAPLVEAGINTTVVNVGDTFTIDCFEVTAVGGKHAVIYNGVPDCVNIGYIVNGVYHPGDSFFVPSQPVETLLVPTSAPWFSLAECIDFVRAVKPAHAYSIHDAGLSARGEMSVDRWLEGNANTDYRRIPLGTAQPV
jgi:L-ascorbate metabolism protein UlaG (beta-lactamase superfamily)